MPDAIEMPMHKGSATRKTTPEAKRSRPKALVEYEELMRAQA
jgi:hypothetical protein